MKRERANSYNREGNLVEGFFFFVNICLFCFGRLGNSVHLVLRSSSCFYPVRAISLPRISPPPHLTTDGAFSPEVSLARWRVMGVGMGRKGKFRTQIAPGFPVGIWWLQVTVAQIPPR